MSPVASETKDQKGCVEDGDVTWGTKKNIRSRLLQSDFEIWMLLRI